MTETFNMKYFSLLCLLVLGFVAVNDAVDADDALVVPDEAGVNDNSTGTEEKVTPEENEAEEKEDRCIHLLLSNIHYLLRKPLFGLSKRIIATFYRYGKVHKHLSLIS